MDSEAQRFIELGDRFVDKKLFDNALFYYDKAIALSARAPGPWISKGRALASMHKLDQAVSCFDNAIRIDNQNIDAWIAKGLALHVGKRLNEALLCFDQAIAINPRNDQAWYAKGVALFLLHRYSEALTHFDRALDLYPIHRNAAEFKRECIKRIEDAPMKQDTKLNIAGGYGKVVDTYVVEHKPGASAKASSKKGGRYGKKSHPKAEPKAKARPSIKIVSSKKSDADEEEEIDDLFDT